MNFLCPNWYSNAKIKDKINILSIRSLLFDFIAYTQSSPFGFRAPVVCPYVLLLCTPFVRLLYSPPPPLLSLSHSLPLSVQHKHISHIPTEGVALTILKPAELSLCTFIWKIPVLLSGIENHLQSLYYKVETYRWSRDGSFIKWREVGQISPIQL